MKPFFHYLLLFLLSVSFVSCAQEKGDPTFSVQFSEEEWRAQLSDEQYHILREKGTERAFSGRYWNNEERGQYECAGCSSPLFNSSTKFKSGTGWPSFYNCIDQSVTTDTDNDLGYTRTEILCATCGGHLGHVLMTALLPQDFAIA